MLEKDVESRLVRRVFQCNGKAYKFTSPGRRSVPDRLCVFPNGDVIFVEVKQPLGKLTRLQEAEHRFLRALKQHVVVVYDYDDVELFIKMWKKGEFTI